MKTLNAEGPDIIGHSLEMQPITAQAFQQALQEENTVLADTRNMFAFGAGHIAGALNLGASPAMTIWGGWFLDPEKKILLVVDPHEKENVVRYLQRSGFTNFAGYLEGGMAAWSSAGYPLQQIPQRSVQQLREVGNNLQLVDVRATAEHEQGYIPGAIHMPLPRLLEQLARLNPDKPTAVYCAAGYRARLATGLLRQRGFKKHQQHTRGWEAWREAGYTIAGRACDTVCVPPVRIPKVVLRPSIPPNGALARLAL